MPYVLRHFLYSPDAVDNRKPLIISFVSVELKFLIPFYDV